MDAYNIVLAGPARARAAAWPTATADAASSSSGTRCSAWPASSPRVSTSSEALIAARAVMGVGAAGVVAPALAIIAGLYPPEERAGAIGLWAVFGAAGLAIGPVMGGLLLDHFWWGSVFLVNVPLVGIGVALGFSHDPRVAGRRPGRRLDVVGAGLSVVGPRRPPVRRHRGPRAAAGRRRR